MSKNNFFDKARKNELKKPPWGMKKILLIWVL
jgi:hypothetical protein